MCVRCIYTRFGQRAESSFFWTKLFRARHVVVLVGVPGAILSRSRRDGGARAAVRHYALRPARGVCVRGESQRLEEAQARARAARGSVLSVAGGAARSHPALGAVRRRADGPEHHALREGGVRVRAQNQPRHAGVHARRLRRAFDDGGSRAAARFHLFFRFLARGLQPGHVRVQPR